MIESSELFMATVSSPEVGRTNVDAACLEMLKALLDRVCLGDM